VESVRTNGVSRSNLTTYSPVGLSEKREIPLVIAAAKVVTEIPPQERPIQGSGLREPRPTDATKLMIMRSATEKTLDQVIGGQGIGGEIAKDTVEVMQLLQRRHPNLRVATQHRPEPGRPCFVGANAEEMDGVRGNAPVSRLHRSSITVQV
jgi:hypothetical protein